MYYCQYHPDKVASYYCHSCHAYSCDDCSKDTSHATCRCFICNDDLDSLGTGLSAEPFWRRLDKTFRYALDAEVLIFIAATAILSTILMLLPGIWSFIMLLMVVSAFTKYCFVCLENTAFGNMKPPSITSAYNDGIWSALKLTFVFLTVLGMSVASIVILGSNIGTFVAVAIACTLPAAIIVLALEGSPFSAVNPLKLWRVVTSIGFAYGVLLAFVLIMSSSVGILKSLFGNDFSFLGFIAQSFISNFYTVVMFHMMGYMIYQYQNDLGFTAREDEHNRRMRSDAQKLQAHTNILLREGDFDEVTKLYKARYKENMGDVNVAKKYFDYVVALKDDVELPNVANTYIRMLLQKQQLSEARIAYQQAVHVCAHFKPSSAYMKYELAKYFHEVNEGIVAVNLMNGIHKDEPEFEYLPEAYALCADILNDLGIQQKSATNFKRYSEMLVKKREQRMHAKKQQLNDMLVSKEVVIEKEDNHSSMHIKRADTVEAAVQPLSKNQSNEKKQDDLADEVTGGLSGLSLVPLDEH